MTRLLHSWEASTNARWQEVQPEVGLDTGLLVNDDSTLDRFSAEKSALVTRTVRAERALKIAPVAPRNHIGLSLRALLQVELHWFSSAINWYEPKLAIILDAIGAYLAAPRFSIQLLNS